MAFLLIDVDFDVLFCLSVVYIYALGIVYLLVGKKKYMQKGKARFFSKMSANTGFASNEVAYSDKMKSFHEIKDMQDIEERWTALYTRTKDHCTHKVLVFNRPQF